VLIELIELVSSFKQRFGHLSEAFVSLREGNRVSIGELRDFCRQSLADYKIPERIDFLPVLPKGLTGKVHRRELKEMALRGLAAS
jgi:long-chain acyl-CoA synthetase